MTAKTRAQNKTQFENGDKPQGSDFENLIDSYVSIADTTAQTVTSKLGAAEFVGPVSAGNVGISGVVTYTGATTVAAIASGAVTLPASAAGYLLIQVSGATHAIPYFKV